MEHGDMTLSAHMMPSPLNGTARKKIGGAKADYEE
tara:strand:+ start:50 stop:154 length:105 start_codon:yes stop_codon:yes gene_type:complete